MWRLVLVVSLAGCELLFPRTNQAVGDANTTDADAGDGGLPRTSCSSLTMIGESFASSIAKHWEGKGQGSHALDAGTLRLTALGGNQTYRLTSRHFYDLTDTELAVDVTSDGNGAIGFSLFQENGDELRIRVEGGMAIGDRHPVAGGVLARGMQMVTNTVTRLVIRNTDTDTQWLVVDNGQPMLLGSEPKQTRFVRPSLFAFGTTASDTTGTFDNLNSGGSFGQACPIAELADTFAARPAGSTFGTQWAASAMSTCEVNFDGKLTVKLTVASGVCDLLSSTVYDLTTGPIAAEISTMGAARMRFGFPLDDSDEQVEFDVDNGQLGAVINGASTMVAGVATYTPSLHRWLRFRYDDGVPRLLWETSGDGAMWAELARVDLDRILSQLRAAPVRLELVGPPASTTTFVVEGLEAR